MDGRSLFVGGRLARKADRESGRSHATDNSRAFGALKVSPSPRGKEEVRVRRGEIGLSGVGDAGITTEGSQGRGRLRSTPWEIFENDCPECHSRSALGRNGSKREDASARSTSPLLRNVTYGELALSTWRYRVERTELPLRRASPPRCSLPGDTVARVTSLGRAALLNTERKHVSVNLWLVSGEALYTKRNIWTKW